MAIGAIQNVSFTSKKAKSAENAAQKEGKKDRYYKWVSQNQANEALKLSVGREVEDGKYKAKSAIATLGAFAAGGVAWFKGLKTIDLMNDVKFAFANQTLDLKELGKINGQIAQNLKVAKVAILAVPVFLAVATILDNRNAKKAEKTANERGFYTMNDRFKMKTTEEVYSKTNEVYERFAAGQSAEK